MSFVYTFAPLADPNQLHVGFYIFLMISTGVTVPLFMLIDVIVDKQPVPFVATVLIWLLANSYVGYNSYFVEEPVPLNEQVYATKSSLSVGRTSGKYPTDYPIVTYHIDGVGDVHFMVKQGFVYPERAILYKNYAN